MELKVNEYQTPQALTFNYDELKTALEAKCNEMAAIVYTDESIKDAKKDKADLNRLKKELNDRRIAMEKEYMAPFNDFKAKVNELCDIIDKPVCIIDERVKDYEARKKEEKKNEVRAIFTEEWTHDDIPYELIENAKWYNASTSISSIRDEIKQINDSVSYDLNTIKTLAHAEEAEIVYKRTLNIRDAIARSQEIEQYEQRKKKAEEARAAEAEVKEEKPIAAETAPQIEQPEEVFEVTFKCRVTKTQALALRKFFEDNGISYERG